MRVIDMKEALFHVYNTESWKNKVEDMPDDQVIAIYYNFLKRGKFSPAPKKEEPVCTVETYEQLSFLDLIS